MDKEVKSKTMAPGKRLTALVTKAAGRFKSTQVAQQKCGHPKQLTRKRREALREQQAKNRRKMPTRNKKGGQHKQGDYASLSNHNCSDSCVLSQVKK